MWHALQCFSLNCCLKNRLAYKSGTIAFSWHNHVIIYATSFNQTVEICCHKFCFAWLLGGISVGINGDSSNWGSSYRIESREVKQYIMIDRCYDRAAYTEDLVPPLVYIFIEPACNSASSSHPNAVDKTRHYVQSSQSTSNVSNNRITNL